MVAVRKALAGGFSGSGDGGDGGDEDSLEFFKSTPSIYLVLKFREVAQPHIGIINCRMPRGHWGKLGAHKSVLEQQKERQLIWPRREIDDIRAILNGEAAFDDETEKQKSIRIFRKAF
jgi:hypothetical protein